jgi:hypothetical protein
MTRDRAWRALGNHPLGRGPCHCHCLSPLLRRMQVRWPQRVVIIRGNHESRQITQVRGLGMQGGLCIYGSAQPATLVPVMV